MSLKKKVLEILKNRQYEKLIELDKKGKGIYRVLVSLSYDKTDVICWRSIEAMGIFCRDLSKVNVDEMMNVVRKLYWNLSDETGGVAWSNPEMFGEIVRNTPSLTSDLAPIIMHLDEPVFRKGVIWAAGRIGEKYPEMAEPAISKLIEGLTDEDPEVRGFAARSLGLIGVQEHLETLKNLTADTTDIHCYIDGDLVTITVGELASEAIKAIEKKKISFSL
jgi:hypothetical protein